MALTGLPASGKSTLAARLAIEFDHAAERIAMTVSSDTVRDEFPPFERGFLPELENSIRRLTLARVRSALDEGFTVIHDDLNYYRSMRRQLYVVARDCRVPFFLVHLTTPSKLCLELNAARGRKIPDVVIVTDAARFDPPGEVAWDTPFASLDAMSIDDGKVAAIVKRMIDEAADHLPQIEEPGTGSLSRTRLEELEILSRRVLGRLYGEHGKADDPAALRRERIDLLKEAAERDLDVCAAEELFLKTLSRHFPS